MNTLATNCILVHYKLLRCPDTSAESKILPLSIFYHVFLMIFILIAINFIVGCFLITIAVFCCLIVLFLLLLTFNLAFLYEK